MAKKAKKNSGLTPEEKLAQALVPVDEQPYPVPGNWCWVQWGICGQFIAGNGFKNEFQGFTEYNIPFYKVGSLRYIDTESYLYDLTNTVNEELRTRLKASLIPVNSILFAKIGEAIKLNRRALNAVPCCIDNNMMAFVPGVSNHKYVLYWSMGLDLYDYTNATTVPAIRKSDLEGIPFPLAPLSEQQRIVARIESLFAKLDEAKEKAQAVVDSFETRKAAILHKAFTGELTERWRKAHGVGLDSWRQGKLIDVLTEKPRNGYSPKPVNYVTPYKSMTLSATTSGVFQDKYFKYIDEAIPEDSYLWLKPEDILIQRANSLDKVGISAIYTGQEHEFIYPDLMMKLQIIKTTSPQFIAYYLKKDDILAYFRANATGTAGNMPKINQKTVSQTPLCLPLLDEQIEIVHILDGLLAKEQQAKETAEAVIDQIGTMKKAILARAFRGELGTNDSAEEWAGELVREALKSEVPKQPREKAVFIPKELEMQIESELERKIIKLYLKNDSETLAIGMLMGVSQKKFEVMDALRNLEQRGIIKKISNGNYSLVR